MIFQFNSISFFETHIQLFYFEFVSCAYDSIAFDSKIFKLKFEGIGPRVNLSSLNDYV